MSLSIDIGNNTVELSPDGDLAKYLSPGLDTIFQFDQRLQDLVTASNGTLANSIEGSLAGTFTTAQDVKWDLGEYANIALVFRPAFSGGIEITKSGPIFSYLPGDREEPFEVQVPEGHVYVSVVFEVNLEAGGNFAYSAGNFGVKTSLTRDDTFRVVHHSCFPEGVAVHEAVRSAFDRFKLPFVPQSIARLEPDDLLDFEFIGKLGLGVGLTYGLSPIQIGGRGVGDIDRSIRTPLAQAALTFSPTLEAAAEFAIRYEHEDAFRFVFASEASLGKGAVALTILRSDKQSRTTQETAGITINPGLKFDFGRRAPKALAAAASRLVSHLDDEQRRRAAGLLQRKFESGVQDAVAALASSITDAINSFYSSDSGSSEFKMVQEKLHTNAALFRLHFDLSQPEVLQNALALAVKGEIADAVTQKGVELEPGSLVENEWVRRCSFGFQMFDVWKWNDALEYLDRVDVVYAGNGYLRLEAKQGVEQETGVVGHQSDCDVHFLAEAAKKLTGQEASDVAVTLQFVLLDKKRDHAAATTHLLAAMGGGDIDSARNAVQSAFDSGYSAVRTTCVFGRDAFQRFKADAYSDGKPGPLPHPQDAENYRRFVEAVTAVNGEFRGLPTYDEWATFNRVATDREGSTRIPDRKNPGNLNAWPERFNHISGSERNFVRFYSDSARCFMNLCEALQTLSAAVDETTTEAGFQALVRNLNGIVSHDVPVSFIKATLLALLKASESPVTDIQAKPDGKTLNVSFSASGVRAAHA
jgi:hypothetical protein